MLIKGMIRGGPAAGTTPQLLKQCGYSFSFSQETPGWYLEFFGSTWCPLVLVIIEGLIGRTPSIVHL